MKLPISIPLPFKRKKDEESEEEPKAIKDALEKEVVPSAAELPKLKTPRIVFVGSSKGGSGKSFISSNLVVVTSALSRKIVYAVDLDLDNFTLSEVLPPPKVWRSLEERVQKSGVRYVTVADVIYEGAFDTSKAIPKFKSKTVTCAGSQLEYEFRLIPAYDYNLLRRREQMTMLRGVDTRLLRKGVEVLLEYFRGRINRGDDVFVLFDGKQKSNIGIEYEPMYRVLLDEADLFILVTEPPYLVFNQLTIPYKRVLDKTLIIVNKADRAHMDQIALLAADALNNNIPMFVIPQVEEDGKVYSSTMRRAPASVRLSSKTALYTMALAHVLGLLDDTAVSSSGCSEELGRILSISKPLLSRR